MVYYKNIKSYYPLNLDTMGRRKTTSYEKKYVTDYAYEVKERTVEVEVPDEPKKEAAQDSAKEQTKKPRSGFSTEANWETLASNTDLSAALSK